MVSSRTKQPVDKAWIDDSEHLVIIDTSSLKLSQRGFAKQQGDDNRRLRTMLVQLSDKHILNERERNKTGICGDGMIQLSIARNMNPERVWIEIAKAYAVAFGRGIEFRNEDPPAYEPPV